MEISKEQNRAICHGEGPMMVLAGPGSGKTFTITRRIRHLILEKGVPPEKILVITFTKAAALEMKQRFQTLMNHAFSPVTFGTFHAIYFHIIQNAYHLDFSNIITEKEKRSFMKETLESFRMDWLDESYEELLLSEISKIKNDGLSPEEKEPAYLPKGLFPRIYYQYEKTKTGQRKIDFDDMVLMCRNLFRKEPQVLEKWRNIYEYIMIDEFQDINQMQYEVVKMLAFPKNNLMIVGDDDQSIYGFRGSKPEIMLGFMKEYPNGKKVLLGTNYRSKKNIVETSVSLIQNNKKRYSKKLVANDKEKGEIILKDFASASLQNDEIVGILKKWQDKDALEDVAVIFRTNIGAGLLAAKLLEAGIPFVFREKMKNPYQSEVCQDCRAMLSFAAGDYKRKHLLRFVNKPSRYLKRALFMEERVNFRKILASGDLKTYEREALLRLDADINFLRSLPPYGALNFIEKSMGYGCYLSEGKWAEKGKEKKEMFLWLKESAKEEATIEGWLRKMEKEEEEFTKQLNEEQKEKGVLLTTMHGSKGLEFPMVILPDLNEGNVPQKKAVTKEAMEEERRVFYVAMTRAKQQLYLFYVKETKENRLQKSRFLNDIAYYSSSSISSSNS